MARKKQPIELKVNKLLSKYNLSRDILYDLYVVQKNSLPDIHSKTGLSTSGCVMIFNFFGIPIRSISQSKSTNEYKQKLSSTLKLKYGEDVKNISQVDIVKQKKKETFTKHYGVDNIWKYDKYYEWLDNFMLQKYEKRRITGHIPPEIRSKVLKIFWNKLNPIEREKKMIHLRTDNVRSKMSISRKIYWSNLDTHEKERLIGIWIKKLNSGQCSKLEKTISNVLMDLNFQFEHNFNIKNRLFDFYIKKLKLIIEVNGDFWHANPIKYKDTDTLPFPGYKKYTAKELWGKDKKKQLLAEQNGIDIIYLWEHDINKHIKNKTIESFVLEQIENAIKKNNKDRE